MKTTIVATITAAAVVLLTSVIAITSAGAAPILPLTTVTAAPGTVLTNEPFAKGQNIQNASVIKRLTYTSRDSAGRATVTSGIVALPTGTAPVGGWPVMAYAHGTVGMADVDAPSIRGMFDVDADYVSHWLAQGYAVAYTDYAGFGTPGIMQYLDGKSAAYNVVDSVRSARAVLPNLSKNYIVTGISQGGHAALVTGVYGKTYAPELALKGIAASGPPTNIENLAPIAGPLMPDLPLSGLTLFVTYMIAGLNATYPEANVSSYLTPLGRDLMAKAPVTSLEEMSAAVNGVSLNQVFSRQLADQNILPKLRAYMGVPVSGYTTPVFISQGVIDTTVPAPLTWKHVADMHLRLQNVDMHNYNSGHTQTLATSLPDTTRFVQKRLPSGR